MGNSKICGTGAMNRGRYQGDSDDDDYIGYSRSSTTSLQSTLVQAAQRFESERRTETQTLKRQHDRKVTELQDQLRRKENELQTQIRDKEASVAAEKARADALEEDSARNRMKVLGAHLLLAELREQLLKMDIDMDIAALPTVDRTSQMLAELAIVPEPGAAAETAIVVEDEGN